MTRIRPEDRLEHLIEAATRVFLEMGYRRAQIADIARAMGVASGTVYLYVESKEALFDLVLQRAVGAGGEDLPGELPLPTPPQGAILERIVQQGKTFGAMPTLEAALAGAPVTDIRAEIQALLGELYVRISRRRRAIKLIERSALDWPELAQVYYLEMRRGLIRRLTDYLELRIGQKRLRPVPDIPTAARLLIETTAWFAMHRLGDPDSAMIDDAMALETVVHVLTNAFVPE
jgi:AcrR family transcriptional regulator